MSSPMSEPMKQLAALPLVETPEGPLVLLITTRGRGRWTIPKGWPKTGLADSALAAQEALEEAGVEGEIGPKPIATFDYTKRLHLFSWAKCTVAIYPLHVRLQQLDWPEKAARRCRWVPPEEAASMVADEALAVVLRGYFAGQSA